MAGLPLAVEPYLAKAAPQINQRYAEAAPLAAAMDYAAAPSSSGELETLYIFELEGRKDLVMDKEIGFPLFEEESPLVRIYTWDASNQDRGPSQGGDPGQQHPDQSLADGKSSALQK